MNSTAAVAAQEPSAAATEELQSPGIKITVSSSKGGDGVEADTPTLDFSAVNNYLKMKAEAYASNEHDAFKLAKKQLDKINHDKVAKVRLHLICLTTLGLFSYSCGYFLPMHVLAYQTIYYKCPNLTTVLAIAHYTRRAWLHCS